MKKADYSNIATFYDKGRSLSEQNMALWLSKISLYSKARPGMKILDLGCGTGRFAIPMAERMGLLVTGTDASQKMLAKAMDKDIEKLVTWDCMDADSLKYADNSFDIVFMSHVLHHVDSPPTVIKECKKILRKSGAIIIRYGAMEQIRDDVEHSFFPGVIEIDEPRTPTQEMVERWLKDAGFRDVISEEVIQKTYQDGLEHLNAVKAKSTSVLSMISKDAFDTGIQRLSEHIKNCPDDPWLLYDKMTITAGYAYNKNL